ncbi:uncharacterized protein LOC129592465 [Paramacrobiotus metropolitanus]|uniref:uncharacterized protein LOC129592465 n=1 Tax=Paramacrobiotus metropolitanus TaxID=2943436 RepID=UPI0024459F4C|nr:uncharacterized protein LOC129592465 [Paramacrobiotus metropolitanus]
MSGRDENGFPLPAELLVEVFQTLDSIGRVRLRLVCQLWDTLLTTEGYFPDVRVSVHGCAGSGAAHFAEDGLYWVVACLLKCLSDRSKMLVLSKLELFECRDLIAPVNHARPGRRLPALVLHDCDVSEAVDSVQEVMESVVDLAVDYRCERMVWVKGRFSVGTLKAVVPQHVFSGQSKEQMQVALWDLLESHLVLENPLDWPTIARWIAGSLGKLHNDTVPTILQGLQEYQSGDPRPSTRYRGRQWTQSDLAQLDVATLTTLTVAFLQETMDD